MLGRTALQSLQDAFAMAAVSAARLRAYIEGTHIVEPRMKPEALHKRLSASDYAALFDAAKANAAQARQQATRQFWSSVEHAALATWRRLRAKAGAFTTPPHPPSAPLSAKRCTPQ